MEALILAIILTYAVKKAAENGHLDWQGSKAANRRSTRGRGIPKRAASAVQHDAGYWVHQVLNGFPQARRGFANGWHAGRAAQAEGIAEREKARTDHLEKHARLTDQVREHRRRQEEALKRIRAAREPEPELEPHPIQGRRDLPPPDEPLTPPVPPGKRDGTVPPAQGSEGTPEGTSPGTSPSTATTKEGTQMASDVTYDGVIGKMAQDRAAAENIQAEQAKAGQEANQTSDEMQALDVDPATLGAMADHLDAIKAAQDAQARVMETSEAVTATLQRQQGQLAEAHKDTAHAADKEFFAA